MIEKLVPTFMIKNLLRYVNTEIGENVQIVGFLIAVGRTNSFTQQHSFLYFQPHI